MILSYTKTEYIYANKVVCQSIWLRRILSNLHQKVIDPIVILYDNMLTIVMTKNLVFHTKSKHMQLRHHFIKDIVSKKEIKLKFININNQPGNVLTKVFPVENFQQFKEFLKITN